VSSGSTTSGDENIPYSAQWDIFDLSGIRQPDDLERMLTFVEVYTSGDGGSFFRASFNVASGGSYSTDTAALLVDVAVTEAFTAQYQVRFNQLPSTFDDVAQGVPVGRHAFLGVWSSQDFAAGFFISRQGWAYTGEVALDVNGDVVPAQVVEIIPGSDSWVSAGVDYDIRIVLDPDTQLLYVYVTPVDSISSGLLLRAILVAKATTSMVSDGAFISAKGTALEPVWIELNNYQLSSSVLLPDLPPVADAGTDQAVLRCSVLQLDGSKSVDPEGAPLTYEWRLVDAPNGSVFVVTGGDGRTLVEVPATGFTDEFYSDELAAADALEPVAVNDVLTTVDGSFTIKAVVRSPSFYVRIEYVQLPQSRTNVPFKLLRQGGISGATTVNPTFYPDVPGFYAFDLRVSDGTSSSSPQGTGRSRVLTNVIESPLPRGCPVDASFIFNNLLSFWQLVEDRDRIATFWEGLARVAATELYTLWQTEYSKSLRDIQRVAVRRWLHYDLMLPEPSPELTTLRYLWGGVASNAMPSAGLSGVAGTRIVVTSPFLEEPVTVLLSSPGTVLPESYAQELQARLRELLGPSVVGTVWRTRAGLVSASISNIELPASVAGRTLQVSVDGGLLLTATVGSPATLEDLVRELQAQLPTAVVTLSSLGELRIGSSTVGSPGVVSSVAIAAASTLLTVQGGPVYFPTLSADTAAYVHVSANLPFTLTSLSTAPGFTYPKVNTVIGGATGGERMSSRTFRASHSLVDAPLKEDDLLVLDRSTYRVVRLVDDPSDPFVFQRIVVKEDLPATPAGGVEWALPGWVESVFLDFWNGLVDRGDSVDFELSVPMGDQYVSRMVTATALGANQVLLGRLALNTAELAAQLSLEPGATTYLARILRRRFVPVDTRVVDAPILTDVIEVVDTDAVLRRNVDYFLESFRGRPSIRFCTGVSPDLGDVWEGERPPFRLWAEYTYIDNEEVIEANFGAAIGLTRDKVPDTVDYLSAVRGIWYALYNGPTLRNLRIALQIFLGLPFAEEAGTVEEVRTDFFTQKGRILVRDTANTEIVRSYTYPRVLSVETNPSTGAPYAVGDTVEQFAPLVTGAEVIDWVKDPKWFEGLINQGIFSEVQKYHSFLVRVDSQAFSLEALLFAQKFIESIKPVYTDPAYTVLFTVASDGDEIDVIDTITQHVTLHLYDTPCDRMGASYYFDEPWPAGAEVGKSVRNAFDTDDDPGTAPPVLGGPPDPVHWGFDKDWLCPEDHLEASYCDLFLAGDVPRYDSVFSFDKGPQTQEYLAQAPPASYVATLPLFTSSVATNITRLDVQLNGPTTGATVANWRVELLVNGSPVLVHDFSIGYVHPVLGFIITMPQNIELIIAAPAPIPIAVGAVVSMRIGPVTPVVQNPGWTEILSMVSLSTSASWAFDVALPGGSYCVNGEIT
jgi:hypothetical protein